MDAHDFQQVMTTAMVVLLLASIVVRPARVACGILYLGVAAGGLVFTVLRIAGDEVVDVGRVALALLVFGGIGAVELVWGHHTVAKRPVRARPRA